MDPLRWRGFPRVEGTRPPETRLRRAIQRRRDPEDNRREGEANRHNRSLLRLIPASHEVGKRPGSRQPPSIFESLAAADPDPSRLRSITGFDIRRLRSTRCCDDIHWWKESG